jgi:hypothetical protein
MVKETSLTIGPWSSVRRIVPGTNTKYGHFGYTDTDPPYLVLPSRICPP